MPLLRFSRCTCTVVSQTRSTALLVALILFYKKKSSKWHKFFSRLFLDHCLHVVLTQRERICEILCEICGVSSAIDYRKMLRLQFIHVISCEW